MRASIRRSASTSASAQSRSIVVVAGSMVRVSRQAPTNLRTESSVDRAADQVAGATWKPSATAFSRTRSSRDSRPTSVTKRRASKTVDR